MINRYLTSAAIALALIAMTYPQISVAETFKGSEFLTWKPDNRRFYIETSVNMAGVIAAQGNKMHSKCIDTWRAQQGKGGYREVLSAMRKFPTYHPQGIIFALLRKACGAFR